MNQINPITKIFWQQQKGGLCRMHSLNAYFGKEKIHETEFKQLCHQYDAYLLQKGRIHEASAKVINHDTIPSNHQNLISYCLYRENISTVYIPINYLGRYLKKRNMISIVDLVMDSDFIFIFNEGHIWGMRKIDNNNNNNNNNAEWYKVDSMTGVSQQPLITLNNMKNIGMIIPRRKGSGSMKMDFDWLLESMRKYLRNRGMDIAEMKIIEKLEIVLKKMYYQGELLGELEVGMGVSIEILGIMQGLSVVEPDKFGISRNKKKEQTIVMISHLYQQFLPKFEKERKLEDIITYVPDILSMLFSLE